jgi:hypothetical protein
MGFDVGKQILKRGGYHAITVKNPSGSGSERDMFICRFEDEQYHLLGYRPTEAAMYFSEAEETRLDLGIIVLPEGKGKLKDLVKGELLTINQGGKDPYQVEYVERCP